jgi:ubiquinone/menaquinone biosynthesis C-methylase UbiE
VLHQFERYIQLLPRPLVRALRNRWLGVLDLRDRLRGVSDDLTPPRSLQHYAGRAAFKAIGHAFVGHFVKVCGLRPDEKILDIGCGTGRMAIPLLRYLDRSGSYVGFDVSRKAIRWCQDHIGSRDQRFVFLYTDIYNKEYNPHGRISAAEYRFPCGDDSIDFAFASSVFTHMREHEVKHYLSEIRRVLKPTGRAMLTFFIIDETAQRLMAEGKAALNFGVKLMDCYTIDEITPERVIAYSDAQILQCLRGAKLTLFLPVLYGAWSGRPTMLDGQDVVVVKKE